MSSDLTALVYCEHSVDRLVSNSYLLIAACCLVMLWWPALLQVHLSRLLVLPCLLVAPSSSAAVPCMLCMTRLAQRQVGFCCRGPGLRCCRRACLLQRLLLPCLGPAELSSVLVTCSTGDNQLRAESCVHNATVMVTLLLTQPYMRLPDASILATMTWIYSGSRLLAALHPSYLA